MLGARHYPPANNCSWPCSPLTARLFSRGIIVIGRIIYCPHSRVIIGRPAAFEIAHGNRWWLSASFPAGRAPTSPRSTVILPPLAGKDESKVCTGRREYSAPNTAKTTTSCMTAKQIKRKLFNY